MAYIEDAQISTVSRASETKLQHKLFLDRV